MSADLFGFLLAIFQESASLPRPAGGLPGSRSVHWSSQPKAQQRIARTTNAPITEECAGTVRGSKLRLSSSAGAPRLAMQVEIRSLDATADVRGGWLNG